MRRAGLGGVFHLMEIRNSVCPYDCPDCCGLRVYVEGRHATRVEGDPSHPFTRGTLCPKMAHYERTVHNDRRIQHPMRRIGKKGEGKFERISWDAAIEEIAARWKRIIAADGAEAILPYSYAGTMGIVQHGAGHAFFARLGASSLDRTICSPAKRAGYKAVMGDTRCAAPQEAQESDCIVLWGCSMLATDIHFRHDVEAARKKGARVLCIDTYETKTAQYADEFFCVKPGTDGAFALGVLHVLAREGLTDEAFIEAHVTGWEALKEHRLPHYTPERAAAETGVPAAEIERFARLYGTACAPFIRTGSGYSRYAGGAAATRLLACLPAAVGAYARRGGGFLSSISGGKAFDRDIVHRPDLAKKGVRHINMCTLGNVLTDARLAPRVRSLYVYASNPACTAPDQNRVLAGLSRGDLFTVVHERFLTDTARYADIVLPATSSLEHDDLYYSYGHYTVERARAVIPPVGESRSNWAVFCALAHAMGIKDAFFDQTAEALVEALIASADRAWELPVDKARLAACEPVELPLPAGYKMDFLTPSGKIEIENPRVEPALPDYIAPYGDAAAFALVSAPDMRILDSSFCEREELTREGTMVLMMHPADAARLALTDGAEVVCENARGAARFTLKCTPRVPVGRVVTEGVWWQALTKGGNVNRLTAQRLTDSGGGSTFYDVCVDVRAARCVWGRGDFAKNVETDKEGKDGYGRNPT